MMSLTMTFLLGKAPSYSCHMSAPLLPLETLGMSPTSRSLVYLCWPQTFFFRYFHVSLPHLLRVFSLGGLLWPPCPKLNSFSSPWYTPLPSSPSFFPRYLVLKHTLYLFYLFHVGHNLVRTEIFAPFLCCFIPLAQNCACHGRSIQALIVECTDEWRKVFWGAKAGFAMEMFPMVVGNGAQNARRDTWNTDPVTICMGGGLLYSEFLATCPVLAWKTHARGALSVLGRVGQLVTLFTESILENVRVCRSAGLTNPRVIDTKNMIPGCHWPACVWSEQEDTGPSEGSGCISGRQ